MPFDGEGERRKARGIVVRCVAAVMVVEDARLGGFGSRRGCIRQLRWACRGVVEEDFLLDCGCVVACTLEM